MRGPFRIEGYAIASADGMIADATGFMPDSLKFEADQRFYLEALDRAAAGFARNVRDRGPNAFGLFSCSKTTNELNYLTQKFARAVIGCNNVDSCNRT